MDDLSLAWKLYLGRPASAFPCANSEEVRLAFSDNMADRISLLMREMNDLKVEWEVHSLVSATKWVEAEMLLRHPNLSEQALSDLGWAFSYDWK